MSVMKFHESFLWAANAGADLSEKVNYLAKIDSNGEIVLAGDGEAALGTIIEGAVEDKPATVQFGCVGKVIAGAAVTAGNLIASDGNGKAIPATAAEYAIGIALASADANDVFPFAFTHGRVAA